MPDFDGAFFIRNLDLELLLLISKDGRVIVVRFNSDGQTTKPVYFRLDALIDCDKVELAKYRVTSGVRNEDPLLELFATKGNVTSSSYSSPADIVKSGFMVHWRRFFFHLALLLWSVCELVRCLERHRRRQLREQQRRGPSGRVNRRNPSRNEVLWNRIYSILRRPFTRQFWVRKKKN